METVFNLKTRKLIMPRMEKFKMKESTSQNDWNSAETFIQGVGREETWK